MINPQQLAIIETQLGRAPRGIAAIAYATGDGLPVVLRMQSLVDGQPFPTLYWLCSRDLYRAIARLETDGWVKKLEQELQDDSDFRHRYLQNHRDYVARRWRLMSAAQRQRIDALGFSGLFDRYGIGGIAQWDKVRCLHMHYADYLATEATSTDNGAQERQGPDPGQTKVQRNVIGERLEQQFALKRLVLRL